VRISALRDRADEIQRSRRWLAFPYAVIKKFGEDSSGNLAVLITYYTFFSIFPLLLALSSILGFVLHGHPSWQKSIEKSALHAYPLISGPVPKHGSLIVVVVGVVLAIYSGLAVAKTAQNSWDIVYGVPRDKRPGLLPKNLRALRLVAVGGLGLIATSVVSSSVTSASEIGLNVGPLVSAMSIAATVVLNTGLFCLIFRWLTSRDVTLRQVLPGAVLSAAALAVLQALASVFITHKLKGATATYGSFGTVIVLLSQFYLQSQVLLIAAQVNVVKQDHLWPRSLHEPAAPTDLADAADASRGTGGTDSAHDSAPPQPR
jgi:membrane protein